MARCGPLTKARNAVGSWFQDNWEYVAGGAMIVAGVALMFTGVGSVAGMALIGGASGALLAGGSSVVIQKGFDGQVDWGRVGTDAIIGGVGGAIGGGLSGGLARAAQALRPQAFAEGASRLTQFGYDALKNPLVRGSIANGTATGSSNTVNYGLTNDDPTAAGYAQSFGVGFGVGAAGSAATQRLGGALPIPKMPTTIPESLPQHALPEAPGRVVAETLVDGFGGAAQGVINEALRPDGSRREQSLVGALLQGLISGGSGQAIGTRIATG